MSGLSLRFRSFAVAFAGVVAFGLSTAPVVGHRFEIGPRPGGVLAEDTIDAARLVIPTARGLEPVRVDWPADGPLTGPYGEARARSSHPGLDIDGETGDPVWAAGRGTVVLAGPASQGYSGYGNMVEIDHGQGVHTLYAHLSRVDVAVGDYVTAYQPLGAMGATGNVTGSHLHFEVRVGGVTVDPGDWLPPRPGPSGGNAPAPHVS